MNNYFKIHIALEGQDQDAPPVANNRFLVICDGLGGDGSAKHFDSNGVMQKSAYLGSREVSKICADFFEQNYEALLSDSKIKNCIEKLKTEIQNGLTELLSRCPVAEGSNSGMTFPTTLAAVVYKEEEEHVKATVIWAGDSRVYMYSDPNGLQQLSKDDVSGDFDACFGKDCGMNNCISQDKNFFINYACYELPKRCVVFACSDGCFDFTNSPMQFEVMILLSLYEAAKNAKNIETESLSNSFHNVFSLVKSGDDCTLSGVLFNYESDEIKKMYEPRKNSLDNLINKFKNADQEYEKLIDENKHEIRALLSENKMLNQDIIKQQRNLLLQTFKEEISDKDKAIKDKNLLNLSLLLKTSYQPYAEYLSELQKCNERAKTNRKLINDYEVIYGKLKSLVDIAEREKRLRERKDRCGRNVFYNAFNVSQQFISSIGSKAIFISNEEQISNKRNECIIYIEELERLLRGIKKNVEENTAPVISEQLANLSNNVIRTLSEIGTSVSQNSFFDEKQRASILSEEELDKIVMPSVIKGGISKYRDYVDEQKYTNLLGSYDEYKSIEKLVNDIKPTEEKTFDEKVRDFDNAFLKTHAFRMAEYLVNFDGISSLVPALSKYQANLERLNCIQSDLDRAKNSQRQVWLEYKDKYELYKTCPYTGVL